MDVGPGRIAFGAVVGAVGGYVLHKESTREWQQLRSRREYRTKLTQQYIRDNLPDISEEQKDRLISLAK